VSRPFCLNCNRIRRTSDGKLRYCLFALEETDIKPLLRNGASDDEIAAAIRSNVRAKWLGHEINTSQFVPPPRPLYSIGGERMRASTPPWRGEGSRCDSDG
jgi:cyclic pyranopterin phosphate synthase